MENCLVTKLKGVVDNDNLPVFNELELKVSPGAFNIFLYGIKNVSTISFDNDVDSIYDGSGGSPISSPYKQVGNEHIRINGTLTKETTFKYSPIYNCLGFIKATGDMNYTKGLNSILYAPITAFICQNQSYKSIPDDFDIMKLLSIQTLQRIDLTELTNIPVNFDLVNKINPTLTELRFNNSTTISGHLKNIVSKFPNLGTIGLYSTSFAGNLNDLIGLSHLVTEDGATDQQIKSLHRNPGITGTIESFAETLCASHTSGYIKADLRYTSVTFGQTPQTIENYVIDYIVIRFSATGCTVEDASSSVKGTYNKSTGTWTYA